MRKFYLRLVLAGLFTSTALLAGGCSMLPGGKSENASFSIFKKKAEGAEEKREKKSRKSRKIASKKAKKQDSEQSEPSLQASAPILPVDVPYVSTRGTTAYRLQAGDPIIVTLRGIPQPEEVEDIIDENGYISLTYIGAIEAAGMTSTELEQAIQQTYVDKQIYRYVDVKVILPTKSYYVRGEVKKPGRFQMVSGQTVMQALATAGGYSEFANPRKIRILRRGKTIKINMKEIEANPAKDSDIEAGDVIVVPRSVF